MLSRSVNTDWAKALLVALKNEAETPTAGWITSQEVARQLGVKRAQANKRIQVLRTMGLIMERQFKTAVSGKYGIVRPVTFYKLTKDATQEERKAFKGEIGYEDFMPMQAQNAEKKLIKNKKKSLPQ